MSDNSNNWSFCVFLLFVVSVSSHSSLLFPWIPDFFLCYGYFIWKLICNNNLSPKMMAFSPERICLFVSAKSLGTLPVWNHLNPSSRLEVTWITKMTGTGESMRKLVCLWLIVTFSETIWDPSLKWAGRCIYPSPPFDSLSALNFVLTPPKPQLLD